MTAVALKFSRARRKMSKTFSVIAESRDAFYTRSLVTDSYPVSYRYTPRDVRVYSYYIATLVNHGREFRTAVAVAVVDAHPFNSH